MIDPAAIRISRLDNGLTLLTESIATVRSASTGIWITRGSRDEPAGRGGVAHFVEHMLFKGTSTRSARDIAFEIDAMGGQLDAFTTKETTAYYAQVLDEQLPHALDLLADLTTNPRFDAADMERERGVILEEIAEAEDDPEDVLVESFFARFWSGNAMARPILGTRDSVAAMTPQMLHEHLAGIAPDEIVITAAGNLQHQEVLAQVQDRFGARRQGPDSAPRPAPTSQSHLAILGRRQMEQVQLYFACAAPPFGDADRYTMHLMNTLLGGSVSSRLFQAIREERGLAYSIYSSVAAYSDCGHLMVSAGTRPANAEVVLEVILAELQKLRDEPPQPEELTRMKDHLKGGLMLGLENTFGRMANLARQQIGFGRTFSLDEILAGIDAVQAEGVQSVADRMLREAPSIGLIAQHDVADGLRERCLDGIELPWGGLLEMGGTLVPEALDVGAEPAARGSSGDGVE